MSENSRHPHTQILLRRNQACVALVCALLAGATVCGQDARGIQSPTEVRLADGRGLKLLPSTIHAIYKHSGYSLSQQSQVVLASANGDDEPAKLPAGGKTLPLTASSRKVKRLPPKKQPANESKTGKEASDKPSENTKANAPKYDEDEPEAQDAEEAGQSEAFRKILEGNDLGNESNSLRPEASSAGETLRFSDNDMEADATELEEASPIPEELRKILDSGSQEDETGEESGSADAGASQEESDSKNCPGSPIGQYFENPPQPDDIDVEEEEHPYDAPAAESSSDEANDLKDEYTEDSIGQLSASQLAMRSKINRTLQHYLNNPENVARRGPWALMHASLPFGVEAEIIAGRRKVNALGWMCYNGVCAKQRMFQATRSGFRPNVGPGVQGHDGQFLAILAQSQVSADYQIRVGNRRFTIEDLVRYEQRTCRERSELTFKLIGLSYYLPQDATWRDNRGRAWNLEKMVAEELAQPINGAACGGTHRLMALSFAVIERQKAGLPITGYWAKAEKYLNDYVNYAMTLQNPDGSFSTEWFESRGQDQDVERKVQTTGHILEWLIYTLPDEHLYSPRIEQSVNFLLQTVGTDFRRDWPIGPRGHALRALSLYSQRVLGAEPGQMRQFIADSGSGTYR